MAELALMNVHFDKSDTEELIDTFPVYKASKKDKCKKYARGCKVAS